MKRVTHARLDRLGSLPERFPFLSFFWKKLGTVVVMGTPVYFLLFSGFGTHLIAEKYGGEFTGEALLAALQVPLTAPYAVVLAALCAACAALLVTASARLKCIGGGRWISSKRDYERDHPIPDIHPVVISRLWNGFALADDVVVGLLVLADKEVIRLRQIPMDQGLSAGAADGREPTYDLVVEVVGDAETLTDELDRCLFEFLVEKSASSEGLLVLSGLFDVKASEKVAKTNRAFIKKFFSLARKKANRSRLFVTYQVDEIISQPEQPIRTKRRGFDRWRSALFFTLIMPTLFYTAMLLALVEQSLLPIWRWSWLLPWIAYFALWVCFDRRRTAKGRHALAQCRSLKRWLEDFTLLEQGDSLSVTVWGHYAVYAYAFDVSEGRVEELRRLGAQVGRVAVDAVASEGMFWKLLNFRNDIRDYRDLIQGKPVILYKDFL